MSFFVNVVGKHVVVQVPAKAPESLASVIELSFTEKTRC